MVDVPHPEAFGTGGNELPVLGAYKVHVVAHDARIPEGPVGSHTLVTAQWSSKR